MFWIYVESSTLAFSSHLYDSKIVLKGSVLLWHYLIRYTSASTCILCLFLDQTLPSICDNTSIIKIVQFEALQEIRNRMHTINYILLHSQTNINKE